jgi:signal transduction histidine kinase
MVARDVTVIRDATRMKANFLSMITHELRSPLNSINGYLDLTLTGVAGELNEQQRDFLQRARAGSEHLYALVEDLLLVSRADAGQMRLNRELTSIKEIVTNAVEELELTARDYQITINVDIANDFPPIYADAVRIQQVLRNLVSNALHFTPPGGDVSIVARIINDEASASSEEQEESVEIQVRDTGYGIAPEYRQHIFERFYQIPLTNAGRVGGQGLGLAIVKMIVELHGGRVTVESAPGQGSTFAFTLPGLLP